jgi:3-dehydroquinate synthase
MPRASAEPRAAGHRVGRRPERAPAAVEAIAARQGEHRYEVRVGDGAADAIVPIAQEYDRVAIVTSRRVLRCPTAARAVSALQRGADVALVHLLPDGERGKTLRELERAASRLLRAGGTRHGLVVSVGGGAVSDAAGFLAATFMRGVDWAAVPTTLLAMVDAAIGGKTGVNLPAAKNAVGAFHPPVAVLADPTALGTLPRREIRSGMGEVLKYALLRPPLLARLPPRGALPAPALVAACMRAKVEIVEADPRERAERKLLNLGHTFGHGVEAAGGFERFTHGESVAVGLAFAFRLAARLGRIGPLAVAEVEDAIEATGLPVRVPAAVARRAAALMGYDKKRTAKGLRWVLPRAAGAEWVVEWDVEADAEAVAEAVRETGD